MLHFHAGHMQAEGWWGGGWSGLTVTGGVGIKPSNLQSEHSFMVRDSGDFFWDVKYSGEVVFARLGCQMPNSSFTVCLTNWNFPRLRPVQTHYTRTIQHSTLYDRHCTALLGKVFKRTIHGLTTLQV